MFVEASLVIRKLEVEGPQLPSDFEDFYKSSLKSHIIEAFASLLNVVKSSDDQQKMPELDFSARRLLFRWFMYCKEEKILGSIPSVAKEWVDLKDENTMYSPTIQDRGITDWEASMCPWWIDYPIGVIPKQEKELRIRFMTEHGIAGTIDTHVDDASEPANIDITHVVQDKKGKKKVNDPPQKTPQRTPEISKSQGLESARKSDAAPSSSFVAESSLGRPAWERRPVTRSVGFHYTTVVDALLVDIRGVDKFALKRWLLATFTERYDYVLDVFAGCGGLGRASIEEGRHCLCMEIDDVLYEGCLSTIACGPMPHVGHSQPISLDLQ
ncbi:hypothetical protein GOP47_0000029 [Adiantum capillus-veneris]|uniref:Uncharacterized protein n=1 Tax=Adiantum capillus-veneris TaxID=13818 RepID=A0A9D4ZSQ1_ADICA|nr:hypothetical protein GOP47_0000029 [Adiantum capillus-veneris]